MAAKPRYSGHDRRSASFKDPEMNARSNSRTMTGADTITSLDAMPQAARDDGKHEPSRAALSIRIERRAAGR